MTSKAALLERSGRAARAENSTAIWGKQPKRAEARKPRDVETKVSHAGVDVRVP
jgi:hypothetical protein